MGGARLAVATAMKTTAMEGTDVEGTDVETTMMNVATVEKTERKPEPYWNSVGKIWVWVRVVVV